MSNEEKRNSGVQIGTLGGCLIEGDSEQKARERKIKRRALAISIVLQSLVLVGLVLTPLLGKTEKLPSTTMFTPMPPYQAPHVRAEAQPQQPFRGEQRVCLVCFDRPLSPTPITSDNHRFISNVSDDGVGIAIPGSGEPTGSDIFNTRPSPSVPEDPDKNKKKRISVGGAVQQAMLVHRVEPAYPQIAKALRKSGQVHLRALIAVNGSIESLQVIDGDPLLVRSALDAVGQWQYRPTMLNGSAVEVETIITVIYTLNQ